MSTSGLMPSPPPETSSYSRASLGQAAADAIPLLVDDTYHVFHLTTPPYTKHHPPRLRSTWCRLRSRNLIDWTRDASAAIKPSDGITAPDADGAWTGAAVIGPDGNMNIFYTGYNLSQKGKQVILRAPSQDRHGSKFQYPGKEITFNGDGRSKLENIDFRDPYIFYNESESRYWMIIASRLAEGPHWSRGCIALLTSTDLNTWAFAPEPLYAPNDMFCPECPELFRLPNGKWYLVYSRFHAPDAGTVYRVADSPYGPFRIPRNGSHGRLDGRRWYAAKSCPKAGDPSKRICFGWTGDYVDEEGKWLWGGDLGLPREVSADKQGNLRVDLVAGVERLFRETSDSVSHKIVPADMTLSSIASTKVTFPDLAVVETQDMLVHFDIAKCDTHSFGVVLQADENEKAHRLRISRGSGESFHVALLTDFPPLDDFWADQYTLHQPRPVDGPEIVRHDGVDLSSGITLILRGQLVEIFCGGRSMSFRLPLPTNGGTRRLGWFVEDGEVELFNISVRYGGMLWRGLVQ